MSNPKDTLAALSEAATQGKWDLEFGHTLRDSGGIRYWQISDGSDAIACNQFCYAGYKPEVNEANAAFIVALVNAYRSGQLVSVPTVESVARLRQAAVLLLNHAEGCAVNHYGEDFAANGMPGWLADCRSDIEAATAVIATLKEQSNV